MKTIEKKNYNGVSTKLPGCYNKVSRMFYASFMDRKFQGCPSRVFEEVLREFQECFKKVLRMIQGSFRPV